MKKQKNTKGIELKEKMEKESSNFIRLFTRYDDSINAIRAFFSSLFPVVTEIDKVIEQKEKDNISTTISDFKARASKEESKQIDIFLSFINQSDDKKSRKRKRVRFSSNSALVNECVAKILKLVFSNKISGKHRELLNNSILMSLVSHFEVLIAGLTHAFYQINPDALLNEGKTYNIKEISHFSSIDEIINSYITERIDKLLKDSVSEWRDFFIKNMKIDIKSLSSNWEQFNEYFQRRHLVVHTGGKVTGRYLSCLNWDKLEALMKKPSIGDILQVNDEYIMQSIKSFEIIGLLLCQEVWKKLVPNDKRRYMYPIAEKGLQDSIYSRLLSSNWDVAEKLAAWGEKDDEASEDEMLVCKFNRWLCIKRQGRWAEIKKEVENFDCSAKNPRYLLVQASLQEKTEKYFRLLPNSPITNDIDTNIHALKEWPIFEEMRKDPRLDDYIKTLERKKSP